MRLIIVLAIAASGCSYHRVGVGTMLSSVASNPSAARLKYRGRVEFFAEVISFGQTTTETRRSTGSAHATQWGVIARGSSWAESENHPYVLLGQEGIEGAIICYGKDRHLAMLSVGLSVRMRGKIYDVKMTENGPLIAIRGCHPST